MSKSYPDTVPAEFTADDTQDAYRQGWNHGHGIACHNVPKVGENYHTDCLGRVIVNADNIREVHEELCHAAADNSRSYSPFEFTAHNINSAGEGGFRLHTADHDSNAESELWETQAEAESAALEAGYALIREYVWEASGYYVQWSAAEMVEETAAGYSGLRDVNRQVFATRQGAMNAANSVGCVAVISEVSSAEELWEAFERGMGDAISADLDEYTDADYGIEDDESDEDDVPAHIPEGEESDNLPGDIRDRVEHLRQLRVPGPVDLGPDDNQTDQDSLFAELARLEEWLSRN